MVHSLVNCEMRSYQRLSHHTRRVYSPYSTCLTALLAVRSVYSRWRLTPPFWARLAAAKTMSSASGPLRYEEGDYILIPKGTSSQIVPDQSENFSLIVETRAKSNF